MTANFPFRLGLQKAIPQSTLAGIPPEVPTLAEELKKLGYRTAALGKW
jgi:arylsulfatase A-like enzyme